MPERVPRRPVPTRAELVERIVPACEPVIFEGALADWPLVGMSSEAVLARFAALAGKHTVSLARAPRNNAGLFSYADGRAEGQNFTERLQRFDQLLDEIGRERKRKRGDVLYMRSAPIGDALPELASLFPLPILDDQPLAPGSPRLWIGTGGHRVATHFDRDDNLLCIVAGRKRVRFYPPDVLSHMYVGGFGLEPGSVATALVDPLQVDRERFPRFAAAERSARIAELGPGDTLYIPPHWWHHVESFELNIAVTFWWTSIDVERRLAAEAAFVAGLLGVRTLPPHLRAIYRTLFDTFVFETHGEPYAHVDTASQGWAGSPTPEREAELRRKLHALLAGSGLTPTEVTKDHRLAPGVSIQLSGPWVELRGNFQPVRLPRDLAPIVKRFRTPIAPRTLAREIYRRDKAARAELERLCHALVARGALVAA